jgi:hypothetical protein
MNLYQKYKSLTYSDVVGHERTIKELAADPIVEAAKTSRSFALMNKKVPQLADKDPQQIRDYFEVIKTFSPRSASNPLIAGALVNKMMEFGGVDHKLIQDLNSIENINTRESMLDKMIATSLSGISKAPKHNE